MSKKEEAKKLAHSELDAWKRKTYQELLAFLKGPGLESKTVTGKAGFQYELEVRVDWEEERTGLLSVTVLVTNVRSFFIFSPSATFRLSPDGKVES